MLRLYWSGNSVVCGHWTKMSLTPLIYIYFYIHLCGKRHITNGKSWVAVHGLNNFHSLREKDGTITESEL